MRERQEGERLGARHLQRDIERALAFVEPCVRAERRAQRAQSRKFCRGSNAPDAALSPVELHIAHAPHICHRQQQPRALEMQRRGALLAADRRKLCGDVERRPHAHFRDVHGHFIHAELPPLVLHLQLGLERQ